MCSGKAGSQSGSSGEEMLAVLTGCLWFGTPIPTTARGGEVLLAPYLVPLAT